MEKSRKTGQEKKKLVSIFACFFLTATTKANLLKGDWVLGSVSIQI